MEGNTRVVVVKNDQALSTLAAGIVAGVVWSRPDAVLGLPTGTTPEGMYRVLSNLGVRFAGVQTFNLDEYVGLSADHPQSYHSYMKRHLFSQVDLKPEQCHLPNGMATDLAAECQRYEQAIRQAGGIDLVVLGLGPNGHIGFNEPGVPWDSRTRRVKLAEATQVANARFFGARQAVPSEALTMGIGSILEARRVLLLVSGASKASIAKQFLAGPVTTGVPATALRQHPDVTVVLDRAAAGLWAASAAISRDLVSGGEVHQVVFGKSR